LLLFLEKQIVIDDRNSTLMGHGYYPAMIALGDTEFDTLGHYRHSLLDNPYCTMQMAPLNYNNNMNSLCYTEKLPKDVSTLIFMARCLDNSVYSSYIFC